MSSTLSPSLGTVHPANRVKSMLVTADDFTFRSWRPI
jgi:hypothetical protein